VQHELQEQHEGLTREIKAEFDGFIVDSLRNNRSKDLKSLVLERIRSRQTHLLDEEIRK